MCESVFLNTIVLKFILDHIKIQEICEKKTLTRCPVILKYCLDKYKTSDMCKKVVDAYPMILRYICY